MLQGTNRSTRVWFVCFSPSRTVGSWLMVLLMHTAYLYKREIVALMQSWKKRIAEFSFHEHDKWPRSQINLFGSLFASTKYFKIPHIFFFRSIQPTQLSTRKFTLGSLVTFSQGKCGWFSKKISPSMLVDITLLRFAKCQVFSCKIFIPVG